MAAAHDWDVRWRSHQLVLGSSGGCQSLALVQPGLRQDLAVQPGAMMAMRPMTALMAMQICWKLVLVGALEVLVLQD